MSNSISPCMSRLARLALAAGGAGLIISSASAADKKSDQEQEYIQVRKIALKDAKVQAAYERADEKLNERILEIDPSLKSYVEKHGAVAPAVRETAKAPAPAPRQTATKKSSGTATTHIVEKGETLSSIAVRYKVSVASLEKANQITDERKLKAGQKLIIPASTAAKSGGTAEKKDSGFWDRLKNDF